MRTGCNVLAVLWAVVLLGAGEREALEKLETQLVKAEKELTDATRAAGPAKAEEQANARAQVEEKMRDRDRLHAQRNEAALRAYLAAAKPDDKIVQTMLQIIQESIKADRYDEALKTANAVIDKKNADPRVHELAGIAAFQSDRFDEAEKHLTTAKNGASLSSNGSRFLQMVPEYKKLWEKEQSIRKAEAKAGDLPRVFFETSAGPLTLELYENEAPNAVANFVYLVEQGFYNGVPFHRVIPNFMAQGGDPTGHGTGGPGWSIKCECYRDDYRRHFRGTLSMAHAGKDTGGSQFFITFVPTQHLDGRHTAFGRVVEGEETLAKIARRNPGDAGEPTKIIKATVVRKRSHPYEPQKLPARR